MSDNEEYEAKPREFERIHNVVEAFQVTNDSAKNVAKWCGGEAFRESGRSGYIPDTSSAVLSVPNLSGPVVAYLSDWVVKTEDGRFQVMTNKDFAREFRFRVITPAYESGDL